MLSEREFQQFLRDHFAGLTEAEQLAMLRGAIADIEAAKATARAQGFKDDDMKFFANVFSQLAQNADAATKPLIHSDEKIIEA